LVVRKAPPPTASQTFTVGQAIAAALAPAGNFCATQVWPALVVRRARLDDFVNPTASQVLAEGQAMSAIPLITAGKD
jgi:hypothetical protein